eukprot:TRINITY_DN27194_c0_g1_i1.p1 TRINITY_DN27194_c0_g1~~TRINITY_DN27194_c0_g1_i1.p1  ORF type:complete len:411 (-),score=52.56 TRINITY_DN27194_c0_g1_i1:87-1319(-)
MASACLRSFHGAAVAVMCQGFFSLRGPFCVLASDAVDLREQSLEYIQLPYALVFVGWNTDFALEREHRTNSTLAFLGNNHTSSLVPKSANTGATASNVPLVSHSGKVLDKLQQQTQHEEQRRLLQVQLQQHELEQIREIEEHTSLRQSVLGRSVFSVFHIALSFTLIIKFLCISSNVLCQISPWPIIERCRKKSDTGDMDSAPFIGIFFCSCQSSFYGLSAFFVTGRSGFLILTYSNILGVTLGLYYVVTFLRNCSSRKVLEMTSIYLRCVAAGVTTELSCLLTMPAWRALFFIGLTSSTCCLIGVVSVVTDVPEVLRTGCSKKLLVPVLISNLINAVLWSFCGISLWDPYIAFPNIACVFICCFALSLRVYYPTEMPGGGERACEAKYGTMPVATKPCILGSTCSTGGS